MSVGILRVRVSHPGGSERPTRPARASRCPGSESASTTSCCANCQTHARCDFMQGSSDGSICYSSDIVVKFDDMLSGIGRRLGGSSIFKLQYSCVVCREAKIMCGVFKLSCPRRLSVAYNAIAAHRD